MKKRRSLTAAAFVGAALLGVGCMSNMQRQHLQRWAGTPITCDGQEECELKWGRAVQWISEHSYWQIRTQTDLMIATENSTQQGDVHPAFVVNKAPLGGGRYQIMIRMGCANIFTCDPDPLLLKAHFVAFVNGDPEAQLGLDAWRSGVQ